MDEKQPRGILFDLDGVLYNSTLPIAGAADAIEWVRAQSIPHLFLTNTTSRSCKALAEKLNGFGFEISENSILTPAVAAAQWLRLHEARNIALFVRPSTQAEFEGLKCVPGDAQRGASYVIVGDLGEHWDYGTLNRAFRLLHYEPGAKLIALGMTRYWRTEEGISLDVAPFVAALEHATGKRALVFGKPAKVFFEAAVKQLGLEPADVCMIGDDIETDIHGAQRAGLRGVLVKTGKFKPADLCGSIKPDRVIESVADLPAHFSVW